MKNNRFLFSFVMAALFQTVVWSAPLQTREQENPTRMIELEVFADPREQLGVQHEWMEALSRTGISQVRVGTSRQSVGPSIEEVTTGGIVIIRLKGVIDGRKLRLPGRNFAIGEVNQIAAYANTLKADGAEVAMAEKVGFGLTSQQLVDLHDALSKPVEMSTKGQTVASLINEMKSRLPYQLAANEETLVVLSSEEELIRDEFQGMSVGVSLAAAIRPLGLVAVPVRPEGQPLRIELVPSETVTEFWPIGWPSDEPQGKLAPTLFEKIDVEIRNFKLDDALNAISTRTGVPYFYDHNSLAEKEVDPMDALVTFAKPGKPQPYSRIISGLCGGTKPRLSANLRFDENGKPFYWIY